MTHLFLLGSHPEISLAEICSILGSKNISLVNSHSALRENSNLVAKNLINRLGGTIKIAQVDFSFPEDIGQGELIVELSRFLVEKREEQVRQSSDDDGPGKFIFGLSNHGFNARFSLENLGIAIKHRLGDLDISSRLVTSRDKSLSSVVVGQNKILRKGAELIFFSHEGRLKVAHTLAIQNYKDLSKRDYGRPKRDHQSGMLPPKLSQILINLAYPSANDLILDPFCGSASIITEAMLMGYKRLVGIDLSGKAIADSRANTLWIRQVYGLEMKPKFHVKDATQLQTFFKESSVGAIVTEPYLGPQRNLNNIKNIKLELEKLYSKSLASFNKILKPGGRVAMIWPVFFGKEYLEIDLKDWIKVELLNKEFYDFYKKSLSQRGNLLYHRLGQRVWRELIILEKRK